MKHLNYILLTICLLAANALRMQAEPASLESMWQLAEQQYADKQYTEAAETYKGMLEYGSSASLYYNYANALYKSDNIGQAILNYERALRLDPSNENIRFNLEYANRMKTDKIDTIEPFFLTQWIDALGRCTTSNGWAYIGIGSFAVTLVLLLVYLFGRRRWLRKTAFFTAIATFLLTIVATSYALSIKSDIQHNHAAIVMQGSVSVKSSPDQSGTEVFVIHEGTKVWIKSTLTEWSEIRLADGNTGWLMSADIEII